MLALTINSMERTDAAYLAGIMDADGYFAPKLGTNSFGLVVKQTDVGALEFLKDTFGGFVCSAGKTSTGNPVMSWSLIKHADLEKVLPAIVPFLRIKRAQAEAMLDLLVHVKSKPEWDIPTSRSPKAERERRRQITETRRSQTTELRTAIREAR